MTAEQAKIAFIGCGHMARSLLSGLLGENYSRANITVTGRNEESLHRIKRIYNVTVSTDNVRAVEVADVVVLCTRPGDLAQVCRQISKACQKSKPLLVSVAAGVSITLLESWLGEKLPVVRSMPNMAASIGMGVTGLVANKSVKEEQAQLAEGLLRAVGKVFWVESDQQIDVVTALAGSGPAYVFFFMDALYRAGLAAGLTQGEAKEMTQQMVAGAASMAKDFEGDFTELVAQIRVKGGTTEAALLTLEQGGFAELTKQAVDAAIKRASEISQHVDK